MRRLAWLALAVVAIAAGIVSLGPRRPVAVQFVQPNILVIVTDDQRAGTFRVMPAVRRWLVRGGTRYPNTFATTPVCCPSRASLLTGLLAHNHGLRLNVNGEAEMVAAESLMLQHPLQAAGYRTGLFGKYLNRWPLARDPAGWDRWATTPRITFGSHAWNLDGQVQVVPRHSTPFVAGRTLDFLEESERLDDDRPWFAYLGIMAPHLPAGVPPAYADEPVPTPRPTPEMLEQDLRDKPLWLRGRTRVSRRDAESVRVRQLRSLIHVDDQVGRLMRRLRGLGELSDTIVIFTSDNGYLWGDHGLVGKQAPYHPSIRVPLLLRWPERVAAGIADERMVGLLDITPTILRAAGAPFPHEMDGVDLLGTFVRRRLPLELWRVTYVPTWRAVLTKRWVYVEYLDDGGEMQGREYYNLTRDPLQLENVFRDGIRGNEPNVPRLHRLVLRLSSCVGQGCLD